MIEQCKIEFEWWINQVPSDYWKLMVIESKHPHDEPETIIMHRWEDPIELFIDAIEKIADDIDWLTLIWNYNIGEQMSDSWFLFIAPHATYRLVPIGDSIYYTNFKEMN